jgi:phenylpropionate dioxygenase-like ring-hydroxylating dioxygenase large terminal subunit
MLSRENNDLITRTGPGTPGGDLLRRYWQPVALSAELKADALLAIRVMSEDLVLFRGEGGKPGLMGRRCPHRRVDLSYGRVEDGGLRCLYHGWLMAGDGRCLDQPGEPEGSTYKDRIRHTAYPCREAGGLVLAYMGPGAPPRLPKLPFLLAPPERSWATKIHHDCNYVQGNEGNIDPQHLSYLHRFLNPEQSVDARVNSMLIRDSAPRLEVEETPYGFRLFAARAAGPDQSYIRMSNFIMPNNSAFDGSPLVDPRTGKSRENLGYQLHWHVPIDDVSHWKYTILYAHEISIDLDWIKKRVFDDVTPDYRLKRNAQNHYLQDREEMKSQSFAGMGQSFWGHDKFAVEAQGAIIDRSEEHLGTTDKPVMLMRRQMLAAIDDIKAGRDPLFVEREGQDNALAALMVLSKVVPAATEPASDWWRAHVPKTGPLRSID